MRIRLSTLLLKDSTDSLVKRRQGRDSAATEENLDSGGGGADWRKRVDTGSGGIQNRETSPLLEGDAMMEQSTEYILSSDPAFKKKNWNHYVLFPLRVLFPSKIFIKFLAASIIPALSQLIPLFYTGKLPDESSLALAGQYTFISIVLEVIQEGIVNSLFHFVGKNYKTDRRASLAGLKLCFLILVLAGSVLAAILLLFTGKFVSFIDTPPEIVEQTKVFLWISSFSFPMTLLSAAITNFLLITTSSAVIHTQIVQLVGTFFLNLCLFGESDYSLQWGVDELGWYKVIQSGFNLIVNLFFLHWVCYRCEEKISIKNFWWDISFRKNFAINFPALVAVSWPNFGESAVRNFFYFVVTLKFINLLGTTEAGAWNLLNTIIFGVYLLPMYSVANLVKVLVGHGAESPSLKKVIRDTSKDAFLCLTAWTAIMTTFTYAFWPEIATFFNPSNEAVQERSATMLYQVGWSFILFSYNTVLDSLFYGTGETIYVFYQSVGTNGIIYLIPWILFETGIIHASYWLVAGLYMAGMVVDFVLTLLFCIRLWTKIPN